MRNALKEAWTEVLLALLVTAIIILVFLCGLPWILKMFGAIN